MKKKLFLILLIFTFLLGFGLPYSKLSESDNYLQIILFCMLLILACLICIFLKKCFYWYTSFMMNNRNKFVVKVDRPRVYIFSLLFPILLIDYFMLKNTRIQYVKGWFIGDVKFFSSLFLLGIIQKVATVFYSKWPLSFQLKWPVYTGKSVHLTDL
ncbi:hypothetical protein DF947_18835 [Pedobacter paludis]|uniref:Uncharacterized protein n=1 Tax=Pedobacter paludis TaxID=2203212 RepID=A0A317EVY3_9SPHI|nr:hypothetical protein DF947_18835 [Pedobacter paludis]